MDKTATYLTPKQAEQFITMEYLVSVGVFDVKDGVVIIDFDRNGEIVNVKVSKNNNL